VTAVTSHISFLARWRSLVTARNSNGPRQKVMRGLRQKKVNFPLDISDCI